MYDLKEEPDDEEKMDSEEKLINDGISDPDKEMPGVFSGRSPFIFRNDMELIREACLKNVSVDYIKQCVRTGRINSYDIMVMKTIYKYRLLNRRMLMIMTEKNEESLKKILRKLVGNGFLNRYYCSYTEEGTERNSTPFFYGVSKGVFEYFSKTWDRGIFNVPDAVTAMRTLAANQFITACREYRNDMVSERFDIEIDINGYIYRYPYSSAFSVSDVQVTFIPVAVRRDEKEAQDAMYRLKVLFGMIMRFDKGAAPVLICEDVMHMAEIRKAIENEEKLKDLIIYYTYDLAIPGGRMFDRIYRYDGNDDEGRPSFSELSFDFDRRH